MQGAEELSMHRQKGERMNELAVRPQLLRVANALGGVRPAATIAHAKSDARVDCAHLRKKNRVAQVV